MSTLHPFTMAFLTALLTFALLHCGESFTPSLPLQKGQNWNVNLEQQRRTASPGSSSTYSTTTGLSMTPRYDPFTQRWSAMEEEEDSSSGYPPVGSLMRQGPIPFFQRLLDPDQYDQGVLKMMANSEEGMDRNQAQGNMDAYLNNPNDWAYQKVEEKKGAPKFDYANANMDPTDLALTGTWGSILLTVVLRIVYVSINGCDQFCRDYHF
jgi:hypothetical protein